MVWEPIPVKAQLRSTIQRLGQLQAKTDADAATTRREIANLLLHDQAVVARAKTQELVQEDVFADLLEDLEQQVGTVLERFSELEQSHSIPPSPTLLEASSSIIFAAPHTHIRELNSISDILSERLGQNVTSSSNHVASGITHALSRKPFTAAQLDSYMEKIAQSHGISWTAGPQRQDLVKPLSELLDPNTTPLVDMTHLRDICNQGIPDDPPWLRARIWKLFLKILPSEKGSWKTEIEKQRLSYYDLIRRLLLPFMELSPPKHPISGSDKILLEVYQHLARVPVELFSQLDSEPEEINTCPLHQNANEDIRIPYSNCLDIRLHLLRQLNEDAQTHSTPEIRLETDSPSISLTRPDTPNETGRPTTLFTSKSITLGSASQRHATALLRLLYIHASINPGNLSPYVPSLLVPLYTVLSREIEAEDLAHAEADCFWLFEALVGEFSELEDDEGCSHWMKELEERLKWADVGLSDQLSAMGLSPALPHYSQRWLSSLLTHTLPLPAVYPVWDVILSHPPRGHNQHPQLDCIVDIATCMVTAAGPLLLSGKKTSNNLLGRWVKDSLTTQAPEDGFLEGLSILQLYPIHAVGGIESILKSAAALSQRRKTTGMTKKAQMGLGARIKVTMWKGFTNQLDSPEHSPDRSPDGSDDEKEVAEDKSDETSSEDETDEGNDTETPSKAVPNDSLTSRLATTVWRGITNQSSMEPPPSPISPSPEDSRPATPSLSSEQQKTGPLLTPSSQSKETTNSAPANLWAYTEKLKDSDTMATFAKISSNWRAKAMLTTWGRSKAPDTAPPGPLPEIRSAFSSPVLRSADGDTRRSSLPVYDHTGALYTPPPRPSFFRNPRDSFLPPGATTILLSPETPPNDEILTGEKPSSSLMDKTRNLQNSLLSLTRTPPKKASPPKAAPRPLLLNSSSLMTSKRSGKTRVEPETRVDEWGQIINQRSHLNRDSMSSVSSLSPSDALHRSVKNGRSEYDSDASTSRVVPLNRRSVSPMALASLSLHPRPPSSTSTISSGSGTPSTPAKQISPVIQEPPNIVTLNNSGNDGIDDTHVLSERPSLSRRTYRKKQSTIDTSDSSSVGDVTSRSARLRIKRHPPRLSSLHIENTPQSMDNKATSPSNLTVPWPAEEDPAVTPRASTFDSNDLVSSPVKSPKIAERTRTPSNTSRSRKLSNNSRTRKVSGGNRDSHFTRDSAAEDGDDEGYDDLLSAYESEESNYLA